MDDTISRQAAINAANRADYTGLTVEDVKKVTDEVVKEIKKLPSAQPTQTDTSNTLKALDCVERRAAIDALDCINGTEEVLRSLPPVQPEPQWMPRSEPPEEDGVYIVYAPDYSGGSSSAKECHNGVMFSKYKNGKWSIEHGYYSRPNCVKAWKTLDKPWRGKGEPE